MPAAAAPAASPTTRTARAACALASSVDEVARGGRGDARPHAGHQADRRRPARPVNRVYVEAGCDIERELYLSLLVDRATGRVTIIASTEGGMEIEEVAARPPREDPPASRSIRPPASAGFHAPQARLRARPRPASRSRAFGQFVPALYRAFIELDCVDRRDQPAGRHRRRRRDRARRQDQLRRQRAVPPPGPREAARRGRGGPEGARGRQARPELRRARRQDRLHGERRRPGDGDDGHHQALRRARRRTSSMSAAAPPRSG